MSTTFQPKLAQETYNGWSNYETWNVALWIGNDEGLYDAAKTCDDYAELCELMYDLGCKATPDGVSFTSDELNHIELDEMIQELRG